MNKKKLLVRKRLLENFTKGKKNLGILLCGQLGTFLKCKQNFYKYVVSNNLKHYNIYIFFVTYKKDEEDLNINLIELPNVVDVYLISKSFKFDNTNEFIQKLKINEAFFDINLDNFIYARIQWLIGESIIKKFNKKIDYLLLSRPDIMYYEDLHINIVEPILDKYILIPDENFIHIDKILNKVEKRCIKKTYKSRKIDNFIKRGQQYFNDTIIISNYKNIKEVCMLVNNSNEIVTLWKSNYKKKFVKLKVESIINFYILEYCKIKIKKLKIEASTYRKKNIPKRLMKKLKKIIK